MTETDDHILVFGLTKNEFVGALFSPAGSMSIEEDHLLHIDSRRTKM